MDAGDWRESLRLLGRRNFEIREMIRLGFLSPDTPLVPGDSLSETLAKLAELETLQGELQQLDSDIEKGTAVRELIAEVRAERIERSKRRRAQRQADKEAKRRERAATWEALRWWSEDREVIPEPGI